jgi:hypothetical protein
MNNNYNKKDFQLISAQVLLLCLLLAFGNSKAFSQCNYVTTENGMETKIIIPCDFPVMVSLGKPDDDRNTFKLAINNWILKNPKFQNILLAPMNIPTNYFIEIPLTYYSQFDLNKKKSINQFSYFYKVIEKLN